MQDSHPCRFELPLGIGRPGNTMGKCPFGMRICTTRSAPPPTHEAPPGLAALTTIQARAGDGRSEVGMYFQAQPRQSGNFRHCGARPDRARPADDTACRNVAGLVATRRQQLRQDARLRLADDPHRHRRVRRGSDRCHGLPFPAQGAGRRRRARRWTGHGQHRLSAARLRSSRARYCRLRRRLLVWTRSDHGGRDGPQGRRLARRRLDDPRAVCRRDHLRPRRAAAQRDLSRQATRTGSAFALRVPAFLHSDRTVRDDWQRPAATSAAMRTRGRAARSVRSAS